jgi:hypothetical protein
MARWTSAVEVTFNDNDGKIGWRINPDGIYDIRRHRGIFGKYRTRWIMLKWFWKGLKHAERMAERQENTKPRIWIFRASIPE